MDILSLKNISFQNILANISLNVPQNGFIRIGKKYAFENLCAHADAIHR